jgi:hypothetical protein
MWGISGCRPSRTISMGAGLVVAIYAGQCGSVAGRDRLRPVGLLYLRAAWIQGPDLAILPIDAMSLT